MDGFTGKDNVIVIAATNRRDILDPALMRPGRFDRQIVVGYPDVKGREAILKVHTKSKNVGPDVDLGTIAKSTVGFTGADLENLVNEACLLAARKDKKAITMEEIQEATIKVIAGPEKKSHKVTPKEKRLTAFHEAGHAVCTYYCDHQDKVHQVPLSPEGWPADIPCLCQSRIRALSPKGDGRKYCYASGRTCGRTAGAGGYLHRCFQ